MFLYALICIAIITAVIWKLLSRTISDLPPGPVSLPFIGHMHLIGSKSLHFVLTELSQKYGEIFTLKLGSRIAVVLNSRDVIYEAYVKHAKTFAGRPNLPTFVRTRNGQVGLSLCDFSDKYETNRRMTVRAIHHLLTDKVVFGDVLQTGAEKMLNFFDQFAFGNKEFYPMNEFYKVVPSLFLQMMFRAQFDYDDPEFMSIVEVYEKWFAVAEADNPADFFQFLENFPNERLDIAQECGIAFERFALSMIEKHEKSLFSDTIVDSCNETQNNKQSLCNYLYQCEQNSNGEKLCLAEKKSVAKIISDLLGGGFDTSTATMSWAMLYFAKQPNIVQRCREEMSSITSSRVVSLELKGELPYLCATIYDLLRLTTVAPLALVHKVIQDTSLHKYQIPEGTLVLANLWNVNHDPDRWETPDELNPEHFLSESGKLNGSAVKDLATFSSGIRRCPGDQIAFSMLFVLLGTLIKNYNITIKEEPIDMLPMRGVTLKPKYFTMTLLEEACAH